MLRVGLIVHLMEEEVAAHAIERLSEAVVQEIE